MILEPDPRTDNEFQRDAEESIRWTKERPSESARYSGAALPPTEKQRSFLDANGFVRPQTRGAARRLIALVINEARVDNWRKDVRPTRGLRW